MNVDGETGPMELQNKVALITGGRRIGATLAADLARQGVDVGLSYHRSAVEMEAAAVQVRENGSRALVSKANIAEPTEVRRLVAETVNAFGRLDILINMASVYRQCSFDDLTTDDWNAPLRVDLAGAYECAQAAVPHMRRVGGGHIICFSDWTAASGRPRYKGYVPYYVAKRAVMGLTEALALELSADNILVNAIAPGPIIPPTELDGPEVKEVERVTPLGRWGGAGAISEVVIGLLKTDFVTGETIRVDGGRHVR